MDFSKDEPNELKQVQSERGFLEKVRNLTQVLGREVIEKTLWLYFAAQNPNIPPGAKAVIYSALAYVLAPLDAIPDLVPAIGYTDDLGVLALAAATVIMHIDENVKEKTRETLKGWFDAWDEMLGFLENNEMQETQGKY
ncbi:MAG: DUF1232 domain-containing protein [Oscillatoriales cyanobacterium SM2_2_1]|nr:DUF1232 domain-containing protein [Oscillatoriales cyanobacterium SM2_2_1]